MRTIRTEQTVSSKGVPITWRPPKRHGAAWVPPCAVEALEHRILLSATADLRRAPEEGSMPSAVASASARNVTNAQPAHLVISPIWDSSITKLPNARTIEATLNTMIGNFERDYTTPITVTVDFKAVTTGLAASLAAHVQVAYPTYRSALAARATSALDKTAVASLPVQLHNPVNGGLNVRLTVANALALGFKVTPPPGGIDCTIFLNISEFNLSRFPNDIDPDKYDLIASSSHELDECLGIGSALDFYNGNQPIPTTFVDAEDLFRYDAQTRKRSFTTNPNVDTRFSWTGGKTLEYQFNQTKGSDYNDWIGNADVHQVQDAQGTPGAAPSLGSELQVLDVLGYTLAPGVVGGLATDLIPFAPQGWSTPLVVTSVKNAVVNSPTLTTSDTIYYDFGVKNAGNAPLFVSSNAVIMLDGKTIAHSVIVSGLDVNRAEQSIGNSLGKLSAGTHTLSITVDVGDTISEIIYSNNTYTRTFIVTAAVAPHPDLKPYAPTGWSSPLVVTTRAGSTTDSTSITTAETLYVDVAYINAGAAPVTSKITSTLALDGVVIGTGVDSTPPLDVGYYYSFTNLDIGKLSSGTHTLTLTIDSTHTIAESNESNNIYIFTFKVIG